MRVAGQWSADVPGRPQAATLGDAPRVQEGQGHLAVSYRVSGSSPGKDRIGLVTEAVRQPRPSAAIVCLWKRFKWTFVCVVLLSFVFLLLIYELKMGQAVTTSRNGQRTKALMLMLLI